MTIKRLQAAMRFQAWAISALVLLLPTGAAQEFNENPVTVSHSPNVEMVLQPSGPPITFDVIVESGCTEEDYVPQQAFTILWGTASQPGFLIADYAPTSQTYTSNPQACSDTAYVHAYNSTLTVDLDRSQNLPPAFETLTVEYQAEVRKPRGTEPQVYGPVTGMAFLTVGHEPEASFTTDQPEDFLAPGQEFFVNFTFRNPTNGGLRITIDVNGTLDNESGLEVLALPEPLDLPRYDNATGVAPNASVAVKMQVPTVVQGALPTFAVVFVITAASHDTRGGPPEVVEYPVSVVVDKALGEDSPGLGAFAAVVAILAGVVLARRRT